MIVNVLIYKRIVIADAEAMFTVNEGVEFYVDSE